MNNPMFRRATREDVVPGAVIYRVFPGSHQFDTDASQRFWPASLSAELVTAVNRSGKTYRTRDWQDHKHPAAWSETESRWMRFDAYWMTRSFVLVEDEGA